jgi:hypothetical protein
LAIAADRGQQIAVDQSNSIQGGSEAMSKIARAIQQSTISRRFQLLALSVLGGGISYVLWLEEHPSAQMLKGVICKAKGSCESEAVGPVLEVFKSLSGPILTISVAMIVPGLLITGVLLQAGHRRAGAVAGSLMAGLILVAASGPIAS